MKHIRFLLLAILLFSLISAPFVIAAEMLEDFKTFSGACMVHLIIVLYSFPVVSLIFLVDHFIIDLLGTRRRLSMNFWKRMGIMLTLGIVYFAVMLVGRELTPLEMFYAFGQQFLLFAFFGLIYELTLRITRKYPFEKLLSRRKND